MRSETVTFAAGSSGTSLSDRLVGRESVVYRLGAEAGQRMTIRLTSDNDATYFNVYEPGRGPGDEALAVGDQTGPLMPDLNHFDGVLPSSGDYSVSVYLFRSAARRDEVSNYSLDISITGDTGDIVEGDFADGLQGGPDFWRVSAGGGLNLRTGPSAASAVIVKLPSGLEVRNLGCRMSEARRWCEVETSQSGLTGWVAGDYLVEASGESLTQLPAMAPADGIQGNLDRPVGGLRPEGTAFTATGLTECTPPGGEANPMCEFGVIREGNGNGMVMVFWPESGMRVLFFQNGAPASFDRSEADGDKEMTVTRQDGMSIVVIGDERYVLPDSVIYGG
jgi:hypothetical protein